MNKNNSENSYYPSYPNLKKIHEGTYGIIYENGNTKDIYKVSKHKDIDTSFIREIYFLKYLYNSDTTGTIKNHVIELKNVITLEEVKKVSIKNQNPLSKNPLSNVSLKSNNILSDMITKNNKSSKTNTTTLSTKNCGNKVIRKSCMVLEKMDYNLKDFINEIMEKKSNKNSIKKLYKYIFIKLLQAVNELQNRYILHNDLKLINILVNKNKVFDSETNSDLMSFDLKLCDFGLAIQTSYMDMSECVCLGTVKYSAPEMANDSVRKFYGYNEPNKFSQSISMDLYSVGIIMTQILFRFMDIPQNIDKITQDIFIKQFDTFNNSNKSIISRGDNIYNIIFNYLSEDPSKRVKIKNVLKLIYNEMSKDDTKLIQGGNGNINYNDYLKINIPNFNKTKYDDFINMIKKINLYLTKHYNYHIDKLNFELQFNIYHLTYYLLNHSSTNIKLSLSDCVKISIYWVLSIYHHRELSNFKKIIKNTKSLLKKNELECRNILANYTKIIPISHFFKTIQLKPKTKQQLLVLLFK